MIEVPKINYIDTRPRPHSSVSSDGLQTSKVFSTHDTVGPYLRWEIDRDFPDGFTEKIDMPLWENIMDKASANRRISVVEAGCGTGNPAGSGARPLFQGALRQKPA